MEQIHKQHQGPIPLRQSGSPLEDEHARHHQHTLQGDFMDSTVNGSGYAETDTSMMMMMQSRFG